ncbi:Long-chain-fatty-acid--CoA/3-oxocholest-4-en-26-oate--CoA ligase [compost metagenome]
MQRTYSLADLFELVAGVVPDRLAVICGDIRLTYAELDERANRLAAFLQQQGVGPGDTVGLQLHNGPEYLEGFFAACKLRALPVNINYRYVADELRYIYGNAQLAALLCSSELDPVVDSVIAEFPGIKARLSTGLGYETALAASSPTYQVPVRSDDDLSLLYTGGTTGMPKGVMWPHRSLFFGALGGGGFYRAEGPIKTPEEIVDVVLAGYPLRYFAVAPMMHGAAMWATLASLFAGQTVVIRPELEFDAQGIWSLTEREQVNIISVVGDAMAMPLLEALKNSPGRWDLSKVVHFGSGGGLFSSHIQEGLRALLPNGKVSDSMGSSEGGVLGSGGKPAQGEGFIRLAPRPDLAVMAEDRSRFVGPGERGVLVRVGHVPLGYFGDPQKSAETFFLVEGQRCANTGDMARVEEDGGIVVLGRGSQCINTGGEKVFPEEVEEVLHKYPGVADALVVGIADARWGQRVSAVVSLHQDADISVAELKAFCREYLAGYKVPKSLLLVEKVSRSAAGKADYRWARAAIEQAEAALATDA